jgi:hypothetical protein
VKKNYSLFSHDDNIGKTVCKNFEHLSGEINVGMRRLKKWMNCEIIFYANNRKQLLTSLLKKGF